jgi:predicted thioesterase
LEQLKSGLIGRSKGVVTGEVTAVRLGSGSLDVLGTPALVALMERAAVAALDGHLPEGRTSVGVRIDVQHLAATPPGMEVWARAELTAVDGRRLVFQIEAGDEVERIGQAIHERVVVDVARFMGRALDKR